MLATNGLWTLGSTGAGLVGILVGLLLVRLPVYRGAGAAPNPEQTDGADRRTPLWLSLFGYGLLVVLAFAVNLLKPVEALEPGGVYPGLPRSNNDLGWVTEAGPGRQIPVFAHPGAILLYTCLISYVVYRATGTIKVGSLPRIMNRVLRSGVNSSLGILAMVGVASIMLHSGMTTLLAEGLSTSFSDGLSGGGTLYRRWGFYHWQQHQSNVLFGALQQRSAELFNLSVLPNFSGTNSRRFPG